MTCCAVGPCDAYRAEIWGLIDRVRRGAGLPLQEQRARIRAACGVCWWADQPQPTNLQLTEAVKKSRKATRGTSAITLPETAT